MESKRKHSPRRTVAQWHNIVEAQQASGLSAPKFCEQKQISYPSFINWKKKLADRPQIARAEKPQFIELTPQPAVMDEPAIDAGVTPPLFIELDLGSGIQLRISRAN